MVLLASRARTPSAAVARSTAMGASSFIANMLVRFAGGGESLDRRAGGAFARTHDVRVRSASARSAARPAYRAPHLLCGLGTTARPRKVAAGWRHPDHRRSHRSTQ